MRLLFLACKLSCLSICSGLLDGSPLRAVKVLSHTRPESLERLLRSLNKASYETPVALEIFVDAPNGATSRDAVNKVVAVADRWQWPHGAKNVTVRRTWVGLRRQWLECYTPQSVNDHVVILEDDCEVSPLFWLWSVNASTAYSNRIDIAGIGLQRQEYVASRRQAMPLINNDHQPYLYKLPGFWGFCPTASIWAEFLHWYALHGKEAPLVQGMPGMYFSDVYKALERQGRVHTVWTMHFIFWSLHESKKSLFTLYANLPGEQTFVANHRMRGEHFRKDFGQDFRLQKLWHPQMATFPSRPIKLGWSAEQDQDNKDASGAVPKLQGMLVVPDRVSLERRLSAPGYDDDGGETLQVETGTDKTEWWIETDVKDQAGGAEANGEDAEVSSTPDDFCPSTVQACGLMATILSLGYAIVLSLGRAGQGETKMSTSVVSLALWVLCCTFEEYGGMKAVNKEWFGTEPARMDLWYFVFAITLLIAVLSVRELPAKESYPLNRAQTNECEQAKFVCYVGHSRSIPQANHLIS
jgi:hypothetical protein